MGKNLSLKFYNGVLRVYVPAVVCSQEEGIPGVYRDVTASAYPAIAYNEQRLWYESQAESMTQYENLAAMENEQAKQLLAENEQAASGNLAQTTATEVDETKSRETEKDTKKDKTSDPEEKAQKGKKKVKINRKKLEDFDYLRQTFYQIDNMTTIGKDQLCVEKLLRPDMTVDTSVDGPEILIYHTPFAGRRRAGDADAVARERFGRAAHGGADAGRYGQVDRRELPGHSGTRRNA